MRVTPPLMKPSQLFQPKTNLKSLPFGDEEEGVREGEDEEEVKVGEVVADNRVRASKVRASPSSLGEPPLSPGAPGTHQTLPIPAVTAIIDTETKHFSVWRL